MKKTLKELREELDGSLVAFKAAGKAIDDAPEDVTKEDLDALVATFDEAEETYKAADHAVELFKRTAEAQKLTAPVADDPEDPANPDVHVVGEPLTYELHGPHSFFRDMYARDFKHDPAAEARLQRHMKELEVEGKLKFDLSSTDAAGGYLVSPVYLNDEFVRYLHATRVVANTIGYRQLPPNTDSINIPTMDGTTTVAVQADNGAVSETDATFNTIAADVKTIAGMQDVSQQLVDRSVPGIDEVIFADLAGNYGVKFDTDVINSSTSNNKGLLQVSGINSVTYTDASATLPELYPKIAKAIELIHENIFMPADAIFMHPRRWAWCLAALDGSSRPLITPYAPQNAAGAHGGVVPEGAVGNIQGLDVYVDANIPSTLGAGTDEDRIIVCRTAELFIWEEGAGPFLETFRDVGSGTLTVRFRLHNYYAQLHARRPKAISVISGTGLNSTL